MRGAIGVGFVVVILVAAAALVKAAVAGPPALAVRSTLPAQAVVSGPAPKPAWPAQGEAAVEVEGLPALGSSGPSTPVPIASVAKVMTAYVVLTEHPLSPGQTGFTVTVDAAAVSDFHKRLGESESVVPVSLGEQLDESQLLQGLLVASGNNFASLLATYDAKTEPAFVAKMQATATSLGMSHTTYTDPSGVESSTVSTASDQLLLASRAMAIPAFARTVAMASTTLPVAGTLANFNRAVGTGGYVGVKTGSDSSSGGCLMFANRQTTGGQSYTIIGVVLGQALGSQSTAVLLAAAEKAADALVHSVAAAVKMQTLVAAGTVVAVVTSPAGTRVDATAASELKEMGYGGMTVPLSISIQPVGSKVVAGQAVAEISAAGAGSTAARARSSTPSVSFGWKLAHDY